MGFEERSFPQNRGDRSTCQANDINTCASTAAKNVLELWEPNESRDVINPDVTPIAKKQYTQRELRIARKIGKKFGIPRQRFRSRVFRRRGIRNFGRFLSLFLYLFDDA